MEGNRLTVFVNGVFNPKEERSWKETESTLVSLFECRAIHVHNPTLGFDAYSELGKGIEHAKKNPLLALGVSMLAVGAAAYAPDLVFKTKRDMLETQAIKVAEKMLSEIQQALEQDSTVNRINLVAHSHGGWCTKFFLQSGKAQTLQDMFNVTFDVYVLGCPVLVQREGCVGMLKQLHNLDDLISLCYESQGIDAEHLVRRSIGLHHSSRKYLEWLGAELAVDTCD